VPSPRGMRKLGDEVSGKRGPLAVVAAIDDLVGMKPGSRRIPVANVEGVDQEARLQIRRLITGLLVHSLELQIRDQAEVRRSVPAPGQPGGRRQEEQSKSEQDLRSKHLTPSMLTMACALCHRCASRNGFGDSVVVSERGLEIVFLTKSTVVAGTA